MANNNDAYIAASASMLQTAANYGQAANLNKKNLKFVAEQNALNRDLWREGVSNQWEMWRATNQYNSPANQRKLLEDAGYNPAALSGMNGAGNANQGSFQASPQMSAAQYQGADLSAIGQVFQNMASLAMARKTDSERVNQDIKNKYEASTKEAELRKKGQDADAAELDTQFKRDTYDVRVSQEEELARKAGFDASKAESEHRLASIKADIEEKYGKKRAEQEYKNLQETFKEILSREGLNAANQWLAYRTGETNQYNAETNRMSAELANRQEEYNRNVLIMEARKLMEEGKFTHEQYELFKKTAEVEKDLGILGSAIKVLKTFFR